MASSTRSSDNVWLIGFPREQITGARLPSGRDIMTNFIFYHKSEKMTIRDSACQVYEQVIPFWEKARLPVRKKQHVVEKIEKLYNQYKTLVKARSRSTDKDIENQNRHSQELDTLFDISVADADKGIKIEEDRQFLQLQKESRTGSFGPVDKNLTQKEERSIARRMKKKSVQKWHSSSSQSRCYQHQQQLKLRHHFPHAVQLKKKYQRTLTLLPHAVNLGSQKKFFHQK